MRKFLNFYGRLFATAFSHAWGVLDIISTLLGVIIPILAKLYPEWESAMSDLIWQIPLTALGMLFMMRLILAPYWLYSGRDTEAARAEAALHEKIAELTSELARPKFKLRSPRVKQSEIDEKYYFEFDLENVGSRPACDLLAKIVIIEESLDKAFKSTDSSVANEVAINEPLGMSFWMGDLEDNEPAHYFVFAFKYKDAVTNKPYSQLIFSKWQGVNKGNIAQDLIHLKLDERQKLIEHLKEPLTSFLPEGSQLSGNDSTLPVPKTSA